MPTPSRENTNGSSGVCMGCCLGEDANLAAAPLAQSLFFRPGERRPPMGRRRHTMAVEALVSPDAARVATRGAAHSPTRSNSVHEWPKTAPRGRFHRLVYTLASPRPARATLTLQQCTQMAKNCVERPFLPICVHSCVPTSVHNGATVYTNGPKQLQEATLANLCTLLCLRGQADPAGSAWTPTRTTDSCVQGRTAPVWERSPG